jgi:asparagine synthetase B (glutamine-hydrolysing)
MLSIPSTCNLRAGWTKYLFRKAMQDSLPKEICWRRDKMGFDTPQQEWMKKGPIYAKLLDWAIEIDHPILEFIDADFSQICLDIQNENFDSNAMFRLFCADRWLKTI